VKTTIELTAREIAELKQLTGIEDGAEAVSRGVREFLRLSRLRDLKAVSGKVEYEADWQKLDDIGFPK
jgi:hypothetical protein